MINFPKKRLQVFVSSTYTDLKEERQAAVEAILAAGHIPAGMELFAAGDESQMEVIRHWIDESDAFLLILGGRYGSLEPKSEKSYIEIEYDYALSKNKPYFVCVMHEDIEDERVRKHGIQFIERDNPEKLKKFRKSVCEKVVSFWKDSKDIKLAIHATLLDFSTRNGLVGWIRGSDHFPPYPSKKTLIFDIDGTILTSNRTFDDTQGKKLMEIFSELISVGFYIVLITSNDYHKQWERVLKPFIDKGIAEHTFCFSDGGTRAFTFKREINNFEVIDEYSNQNIISANKVNIIEQIFQEELDKFIIERAMDTSTNLLMPSIEWVDRTLDYIDIKIHPLKPSFLESDLFNKFQDKIIEYSHNPPDSKDSFKTSFSLKKVPNSLLIRATGQDNESEVARFEGIIYRYLLSKIYQDLSKPEIQKRGGEVICQVALKPFNDHKLRESFRDTMDNRLNKECNNFDVSIGGSTTIDIQIKGVDKAKAIRYLINDRKINPQDMVFFGDEFFQHGNDLSVALMKDDERPRFILNVGNKNNVDIRVVDRIIPDGNGPHGTENYLRFLLNQYSEQSSGG